MLKMEDVELFVVVVVVAVVVAAAVTIMTIIMKTFTMQIELYLR